MPPTSSIQTFINALRTGHTRTTSALDELFTAPGKYNGAGFEDALAALSTPHGLNGAVPEPIAEILRSDRASAFTLSEAEISHLGAWPNAQKEVLRDALVTAIAEDRDVRFFWELYSGATPVTVVLDLGNLGMVVRFRSPRSRVTLDAAGTQVTIADSTPDRA